MCQCVSIARCAATKTSQYCQGHGLLFRIAQLTKRPSTHDGLTEICSFLHCIYQSPPQSFLVFFCVRRSVCERRHLPIVLNLTLLLLHLFPAYSHRDLTLDHSKKTQRQSKVQTNVKLDSVLSVPAAARQGAGFPDGKHTLYLLVSLSESHRQARALSLYIP